MQTKSVQCGKPNAPRRGTQVYKVVLKPFAGLAIVLSCWGVFAADVTIPSTWDEASQTYIGDVVALTNAMANLAAVLEGREPPHLVNRELSKGAGQ